MPYLATVAPFGFADFNPPTLLRLYRRLGCRTCQFYRNADNLPDHDEARRIVEDAGLPFDAIHGLFGPAYDPSSPDETTRREAVDIYRGEGELAVHLGGPRVVVHPAPPAADPTSVTAQTRAARVGPLRKTMEELAQVGERLGVTYLFENIPDTYHFGSDVQQLARIIRGVGHPNIRMCFDTGHAHMSGHAPDALHASHDTVAYFHVHDNDGHNDTHQVPGRGTIPWQQLQTVMAMCRPDTPAMLELFESEPDLEREIAEGLGDKLAAWLAVSPATAQ